MQLRLCSCMTNFVLEYRRHYKRVTDEKLPKGLLKYEKSCSLFTLIDILYSTMRQKSPEATTLSTLLAFMGSWRFPLVIMRPPYPVNHEYAHDLMWSANPYLDAVLTDESSLKRAVSHLSNACLIRTINSPASSESVTMHNIICQWIVETVVEKDQWILLAASRLSTYTLLSQERHAPVDPHRKCSTSFSALISQ